MVGGSLAADAHVLVLRPAGADGHVQQALDGFVPLVEQRGDLSGVPIQPQRELRHVVRTDRHAVEIREVAVRQQRIARQLAHHDQFQPVFAPGEPVLGQQFDHLARFCQRPHEGHHDLDVFQPHAVAHTAQRAAFEFETGLELLIDIPRRAPEPQHWVFLPRLVPVPANQVGVLVGLEVRQPHDHRFRREGGGDGADPFAEFLHVERDRIAIPGHVFLDEFLYPGVLPVEFDQRPGMDADHAVDDEFQPGQADAVIGDGCEHEGPVGVADVHGELDWNVRQFFETDFVFLVTQSAPVDEALVSLRAGDGDFGAIGNVAGGVTAAHHGRNAQFAGDDGSMAGAAAAVGDDG